MINAWESTEGLTGLYKFAANPPYELLPDDFKVLPDGTRVFRIRAIRDISPHLKRPVRAGDLGGYVQSRNNLVIGYGETAWVYDEAVASGDAVVTSNSKLYGHAQAEGRAFVISTAMSQHSRVSGDAVLINCDLWDDACIAGCVIAERYIFEKNIVLDEACLLPFVYGAATLPENEGMRRIVKAGQLEDLQRFKLPLPELPLAERYVTHAVIPNYMNSKLKERFDAHSFSVLPEKDIVLMRQSRHHRLLMLENTTGIQARSNGFLHPLIESHPYNHS